MLDLRKVTVTPETLACLSGAVARRLQCLPLGRADGVLTVAVKDSEDYAALDQIQRYTGLEVRPLPVGDPALLDLAIRRYYPAEGAAGEENAPALFRSLLHRAVQIRASDIHLDPCENGGKVLFRVDGTLRLDRSMPAPILTELVSAIKIMANLDIAERRVPQDGQFEAESEGERFSLRVATLPVIYGEKVTLRLLPAQADVTLSSLDSLGMSARHYATFLRALDVANGILLLTGPTGSGKTTTLYAALRRLAASGEEHILSIEDPIEIPIPGVNQVRVRHEEGLTGFLTALRSALRHDPDTIMIGEIRDAESADIAVKAAMTGHLVLSTLHTNDAIGIIFRLENLGIPPYLVAATLRLASAQRLVRTPCAYCVTRDVPPEDLRMRLGLDAGEKTSVARGCALCGGTGYAGRIGLFEMIPMDDTLRSMIMNRAGEIAMRNYVFGGGANPTLSEDGVAKIRQHITTAEEVDRAVLLGV